MRLAAPLQSWGATTRFTRCHTRPEPTKSGIIGMVAAALGVDRADTATLAELAGLRFGVRIDQPGGLLRDYHTANNPAAGIRLPPTTRDYLTDAVFLAALEGGRQQIAKIEAALRQPHHPLYLGRRSCPPAGPVSLGVRDSDLDTVLAAEAWAVLPHTRKQHRHNTVDLEICRDALPGEATEIVHDLPLSFDPRHRRYHWRPVVRRHLTIPNPDAPARTEPHDPMSSLS